MKTFAVLVSGFILFVLAAFSAEAATPEAAKRVALVIGNSKYVNAVPLPNPANDAQLIASTLRNAGFDVIEGVDQDNQGMHSLISRFTEESYNADLAVIFYAGHGMQVDGKNYLIPVDAELTSPAYLKTRTVQIDEFMAALPPDPAVGVIILDACRDNPLARTLAASLPKSRSLGAGLAPVEAKADGVGTGGVLIAYATDPGAIAFDGNGVDSPYSLALAKHLTEPGIEIQSALTRVRGEVTEATQGRQRPWHNASLGREVFLGKPAAEAAPVAAPVADAAKTTAAAAPAPVASEPPSWEVEQRLWDEASKKNAIPFYEAYLEQFPNGRFATVAKLNIDQLKDPKANKQVAALDANGADANAGSAVRTSVGITDAMKQTPGTEQTEGAIGLDRDGRIDLQLRIEALGNELGQVDGNIGPRTRQAIGVWQGKNGLPQTTYLTGEQLAFLVIQTDPMMDAIRAKNAADQARAAAPKKPVAQKTRTLKPVVAQKPRKKQQQVVQRRRNSETVVREEGPPPNDNNDFLTKALIFGTGVAVGGVLNKP
ncbi:caspase family protein [Mesorhizobium captivum]|uniref:caspase family protein n=1 Tax=Mesorhizobium captivum TaxID=3072319 RepID=UPI002A24729F|nr:caspase family protein [Mesorhizobium sp. VK22E]MDX8507933.1 caspase family protein [Mesorhizobium sp. VK22E]